MAGKHTQDAKITYQYNDNKDLTNRRQHNYFNGHIPGEFGFAGNIRFLPPRFLQQNLWM